MCCGNAGGWKIEETSISWETLARSVGNEPRFPRHHVAFSNFLPFSLPPTSPRHVLRYSPHLDVHIPAALVLFRVTAPFIFRSFALAEISRFAARREFTSVDSPPPQGKSKSLQIKEAPTRVNLPVLFEWMASLLHPIAAGSTFLSFLPSFLPSLLLRLSRVRFPEHRSTQTCVSRSCQFTLLETRIRDRILRPCRGN